VKKTVTYPVRMSPDLYKRVKRRAALDGRTAASYMRRVLDLATRGELAANGQASVGGELERKQNERQAA